MNETRWSGPGWAWLSGLPVVWFAAARIIGAERLLAGGEPALFAPTAITASAV